MVNGPCIGPTTNQRQASSEMARTDQPRSEYKRASPSHPKPGPSLCSPTPDCRLRHLPQFTIHSTQRYDRVGTEPLEILHFCLARTACATSTNHPNQYVAIFCRVAEGLTAPLLCTKRWFELENWTHCLKQSAASGAAQSCIELTLNSTLLQFPVPLEIASGAWAIKVRLAPLSCAPTLTRSCTLHLDFREAEAKRNESGHLRSRIGVHLR